jgi:hypothetical protein
MKKGRRSKVKRAKITRSRDLIRLQGFWALGEPYYEALRVVMAYEKVLADMERLKAAKTQHMVPESRSDSIPREG